jgi:hypothetical protein
MIEQAVVPQQLQGRGGEDHQLWAILHHFEGESVKLDHVALGVVPADEEDSSPPRPCDPFEEGAPHKRSYGRRNLQRVTVGQSGDWRGQRGEKHSVSSLGEAQRKGFRRQEVEAKGEVAPVPL